MTTKWILIVDDNDSIRQLLAIQMKKLGFATDFAVNGNEAIQAANIRRYDLIIMDSQMPVLAGAEAIKSIRQNEANAGLARTPIIALSSDLANEKKMLDAGADEFIQKPISLRKLKSVVQSWCS